MAHWESPVQGETTAWKITQTASRADFFNNLLGIVAPRQYRIQRGYLAFGVCDRVRRRVHGRLPYASSFASREPSSFHLFKIALKIGSVPLKLPDGHFTEGEHIATPRTLCLPASIWDRGAAGDTRVKGCYNQTETLPKIREFRALGLEPFRRRPFHFHDDLGESVILAEPKQHVEVIALSVDSNGGRIQVTQNSRGIRA